MANLTFKLTQVLLGHTRWAQSTHSTGSFQLYLDGVLRKERTVQVLRKRGGFSLLAIC